MSYIDLNDDNICGELNNNHILMTKTKHLFSCDYKCYLDPVNQLVHNNKDNYDYKIVVSNIKTKHLIYDKIRQIGSIELKKYTQDARVFECNLTDSHNGLIELKSYIQDENENEFEYNLTDSNEKFIITKTIHKELWTNDRFPPAKLIFEYNGNKYESKEPKVGKTNYTLKFTSNLTKYIKSSRSNIIIVDNNDDTLFECVKIDTKGKYIITPSDKIPLLYSFILSCINNFSNIFY